MPTPQDQSNNPLHGITLEKMLTELHEKFGWEKLAYFIPINCFSHEPSVKSSLKFLRRMPWARAKVEKLYLDRIVSEKLNGFD
ncbi:MAG: VF530 family protein [Crocinitomicaceae bacterium]|jgi:uncharacterized protein (DUF2132 family)|nr:VF530 family protein [Crocinitomicaceae bacterium]MCX6190972.1 VF530 family protein [Flavobacteriia bacterium]